MKRLWLTILMAGVVLLFATASNYGLTNIVGLIFFAIGAWKLNLFNSKSK